MQSIKMNDKNKHDTQLIDEIQELRSQVSMLNEIIAINEEVEEKLSSLRQKKEDITSLYSNVLTMKEYRLTPSEWFKLSKLDKKILTYARIMEVYYIEFSPERIKMRKQIKKAEYDKKMNDLMGKMPVMQKSRRHR